TCRPQIDRRLMYRAEGRNEVAGCIQVVETRDRYITRAVYASRSQLSDRALRNHVTSAHDDVQRGRCNATFVHQLGNPLPTMVPQESRPDDMGIGNREVVLSQDAEACLDALARFLVLWRPPNDGEVAITVNGD